MMADKTYMHTPENLFGSQKFNATNFGVISSRDSIDREQKVAETFSRNHADVLQDNRNLNCSNDFHRLNFQPIEYLDSKGRKQIASEITKDGFSFLVMGYTGERAGQFKRNLLSNLISD
jgi:Rha family phage regulatory protein